MTMRLDIVTNDAGELVRREHARDLGAGVVIAIYRLAKLAQMHDLTNQAFLRQLEQTHQMIGEYGLRSGGNVNILFAHKAVFVAGQLLKGSRSTYEAASELGDILERIGGSELHIQRDVTREELLAFAEQISLMFRSAGGTFQLPPRIRLRPVNDAARLRGLELENLRPDQRIVRTYASAVVIMRRFFEDLVASKYILPRRIKRIAQNLVDLSEGSTPAFLGVTEVRNANFDEAGRAVNSAILAVSMARELTQDRAILSQIAMAAMMHDVARPRALALAAASGPAMPGMAGPTMLSEDQEDRLAAGAAAVLTALGRVNEPSVTRTVLAFEALWLRRQTWLGPVYWGARAPTLHAKIIAIARRYNDLLTPEPGLLPPTPDFAIATLSEELKDPQDRTVLRMLVSALGLLPAGTVVQLATGEMAEVVRGAKGVGDKPRVRLLRDPHGGVINPPVELELADDPRRPVARVVSVDGWRKGLEQAPNGGVGPDAGYGSDAPPAPSPAAPAAAMPAISPLAPMPMPVPGTVPAPPPPSGGAGRSIADQYADQYAAWGNEQPDAGSGQSGEHNSSSSLPSLGSSPSAVAEAMGRMINDSLAPPAVAPREAERTVFQRSGPEDAADRATDRPAEMQREPTARGNLAATPLPHVLVYMLDHALTGSVVFEGGSGEDTIYFVNGVPAKVRLQEQVAMLGEMLVRGGGLEEGSVDAAVDGARRLGILLGEYLVGHDLTSREMVAWALEAQMLERIAHLANMPPEITYSYYRDVDLLEGWGGGDVSVGVPLNPILASVRNWTDRARVRATLNRIGKHPLVIHEDAEIGNMALLPEEQATLDVIRSEALSLPNLFKRNIADEEIVSSLVYTLAVTRQFAFKGQKKGPMAARGGSAWKAAAPASGSQIQAASVPALSSGSMPVPSVGPPPASQRTATPSRPAGVAAASSSRPNVQAASSPRQAAVGAPPAARPPSGAATPAAGPRPIAPAVRPASGARPNAPQIRPMTAKKATIAGLQPAAPPVQRKVEPKPAAPAGEGGGLSRETPADGMKTVAIPAPSLRSLQAKGRLPEAPPPAKVPPPSSPRVPAATPAAGAPRTGPAPGRGGLPLPSSRSSPPRPGAPKPAPSAAARPAPAPASAKKASSSGAVAAATADSTDEIQIELDDGPVRPGTVEIGQGGMEDAEAALEAMTNFRLAEAALQRNDVDGALRLAQKAVDGDPTQGDYVTLLAWVRALGGSPSAMEEAIATMGTVLAEDPTNERALLYRGKLLVRTNRFQEALRDFDELLAGNPHHREAANELRLLKQRMS